MNSDRRRRMRSGADRMKGGRQVIDWKEEGLLEAVLALRPWNYAASPDLFFHYSHP